MRLDTSVEALGLSTRAHNALERINVATVREFLGRAVGEFQFMRGVGNKTRKEIVELLGKVRERFPDVPAAESREAEAAGVTENAAQLGLYALRQRPVGSVPTGKERRGWEIRNALLGLGANGDGVPAWPTQIEVADRLGVSRQRISQVLTKDRLRWARDGAVTALREELVKQVYAAGGVLTGREVIDVLLARRNLDQLAETDRPHVAAALARLCGWEADQTSAELAGWPVPATGGRASGQVCCSHLAPSEADQVERLAEIADELADEDPAAAAGARAPAASAEVASPPLPEGCTPFSNDRLLRLAVAVARTAALSPRQEIYLRGMPAGRAPHKRARAALDRAGGPASRFPLRRSGNASRRALPGRPSRCSDRPALDELLKGGWLWN